MTFLNVVKFHAKALAPSLAKAAAVLALFFLLPPLPILFMLASIQERMSRLWPHRSGTTWNFLIVVGLAFVIPGLILNGVLKVLPSEDWHGALKLFLLLAPLLSTFSLKRFREPLIELGRWTFESLRWRVVVPIFAYTIGFIESRNSRRELAAVYVVWFIVLIGCLWYCICRVLAISQWGDRLLSRPHAMLEQGQVLQWEGLHLTLTVLSLVSLLIIAVLCILIKTLFAYRTLGWSASLPRVRTPPKSPYVRVNIGNPQHSAVNPEREECIAHLSDLHIPHARRLTEEAEWQNDFLDRCVATLDRIDRSRQLSAIVFSGDVTDTGHEDAWAAYRYAFEKYRNRIVIAPGNHDLNVVGYGTPSVFLVADAVGAVGRLYRMRQFMETASNLMGDRASVQHEGNTMSLARAWKCIRGGQDDRTLLSAAHGLFPFVVTVSGSASLYIVWNTVRTTMLAANNSFGFIDDRQLKNFCDLMSSGAFRDRHGEMIHIMHHKLAWPEQQLFRKVAVQTGCPARRMAKMLWQAVKGRVQLAGMVMSNADSVVKTLLKLKYSALVLHGHHHTSFHGRIVSKVDDVWLDVVSAPSTTLGTEFLNHTGCSTLGFDILRVHTSSKGRTLLAAPIREPI